MTERDRHNLVNTVSKLGHNNKSKFSGALIQIISTTTESADHFVIECRGSRGDQGWKRQSTTHYRKRTECR